MWKQSGRYVDATWTLCGRYKDARTGLQKEYRAFIRALVPAFPVIIICGKMLYNAAYK